MLHILLVDDDRDLVYAICKYFSNFTDYKITYVYTGSEALSFIKSSAFDAIVLDVLLPDVNGNDICKEARNFTNAPILFLSNYSQYEDRILGLCSGADDYICKPFSLDELKIRIDLRIHQRYEERPAQQLSYGDFTMDTGTLQARYKEHSCQLTVIEFSILELLARQPQRIFSYEQIYAYVWKEPINASRHTLQARVAELRVKITKLCDGLRYIDTIRGKGYRFNPTPCASNDSP